jgi:hypothetical protein
VLIIRHFALLQVCFFGENYPHFLFVDDIQFVKVRLEIVLRRNIVTGGCVE